MTTIYLIRHAEAEGNLYRRFQGNYNSLITELGYRQIAALTQRFRGISVDAVYASDLFRTCTTARAVYQPKGLKLHKDKRLREISGGDWEDRSWGDLACHEPKSLAEFNDFSEDWCGGGGEHIGDVRRRMREVLGEIAANHPEQTVAVVSHACAIRTFTADVLGCSMAELSHCDNTGVTCLNVDGGAFSVEYYGDASHLTPELSTSNRLRAITVRNGGTIQVWFRPICFPEEQALYNSCRREAWMTIHKTAEHFDGEVFLRDAMAHSAYSSDAVMVAMVGDRIAGLIQMDFLRDAEKGIGGIPFFYVMPEFRDRRLGVQLLGQAVSTYRKLGRDRLRLRCAPDNLPAQHFYTKYGFEKVGVAQDSRVPLDLLDKYIGYDEDKWSARLSL